MIVLHTDEDDLVEVLHQCLFELLPTCSSQFDAEVIAELDELNGQLDDWEQEEKVVRKEIIDLITNRYYFSLREKSDGLKSSLGTFMQAKAPFSKIAQLSKDLKLNGRSLRNLFLWAIREYERKKFRHQTVDERLGIIKWQSNGDRIWLRSARGFVAFTKKNTSDLLGELQVAIEDWQPTPSRLISAKYRDELTGAGVIAEDRTLSKKHAFAYFYKDLKSPGNPGLSAAEASRLRMEKLKAHVAGKSEALTTHIEDAVIEFAEKICEIEEKTGANFGAHYGVVLTDENELKKAQAHYNSYVSTLPLKNTEEQLDSGHVFKLDGAWWVCATPACDLQPGQNTTAFTGASTNLRPFTALRLENAGDDYSKITNDHINSGLFCFVETKKSHVECLGLQKVDETNPFQNGKVTWRTFVAEENGLISEGKLKITVPKLSDEGMKFETPKEANVVAKLRYEYALNYIQKVGASVTRIGLGYAS